MFSQSALKCISKELAWPNSFWHLHIRHSNFITKDCDFWNINPRGLLKYLCCTQAWQQFFKTYLDRDLPSWEKASLNKNFVQFCTRFVHLNKIFWGFFFCGIELFEKWPLILFPQKQAHFDPQSRFLRIVFSLKKNNLCFCFCFSSPACVISIWVPLSDTNPLGNLLVEEGFEQWQK